MKLLHMIGLTACMALTATSAPAGQEPPTSQELSAASPDTTAAADTKPYQLDKLWTYLEQRWDLVKQINAGNNIIIKHATNNEAADPAKYEPKITHNFDRMNFNTKGFAAQLDRNVASMASLAKPVGSPYKGIKTSEIYYLYGMTITYGGYCELLQKTITDKNGTNTYISPFLWEFAFREIQQGQASVKAMKKNFDKLAEFVKASKPRQVDGEDYYTKAIDQINSMYAKGGKVYSYINWPAPPPETTE